MPHYRLTPDEFAQNDSAFTEYIEQAHTITFVAPHQRDDRQSYFDNEVTVEFDETGGPEMYNALRHAQLDLGTEQSVFALDGPLNVSSDGPHTNQVGGPVGAHALEQRGGGHITVTLDDTTIWLTNANGLPANLRPLLSLQQARQLRDQLDEAIDEAINQLIPSARLEYAYDQAVPSSVTPSEDPFSDEDDDGDATDDDRLPPEFRNEESDDDEDFLEEVEGGLGDLFG